MKMKDENLKHRPRPSILFMLSPPFIFERGHNEAGKLGVGKENRSQTVPSERYNLFHNLMESEPSSVAVLSVSHSLTYVFPFWQIGRSWLQAQECNNGGELLTDGYSSVKH